MYNIFNITNCVFIDRLPILLEDMITDEHRMAITDQLKTLVE